MIAAKTQRKRARVIALAAGTVLTSVAMQAGAATQQYFDVNGTTAGQGIVNNSTYSWESAFWNTNSTGTTATTTFIQDGTGFARFYGGTSGNTYTVNVGAVEPMAGLFLNKSGLTLNINQAPSTSGGLQVASVGGQALSGGNVQGFLVIGTAVNINAPISGPGGVQQSQSGALSMYGNNSFSGGFATTGGQVTNYKAANAFGSGTFTFSGTGGQGLVNNGPSGQVYANTLNFGPVSAGTVGLYTSTNTNFVAGAISGSNPGTKWTGPVYLPPASAGATTLWTQGTATSVTEFSGVISGDGPLVIGDAPVTGSATARGTIILSGASTFTGNLSVGNGTVKLGAANTIASIPELDLNGGTFNPGSFVHVMSSTLLNIFTISTSNAFANIDVRGGGQVQFSESTNTEGWDNGNFTGILNVIGPYARLQFGTDNAGLRSDQLAMIEFNSDPSTLGGGWLTNDGYLVPEPSSALVLLGAPLLLRRRRRMV